MLYDSICWTACPNLIVKFRIDSSSYSRIDYKELMFIFCLIEQRYCDTNAPHSSLNEFIELRESLWNYANSGPCKLAGNMKLLPTFRIIT